MEEKDIGCKADKTGSESEENRFHRNGLSSRAKEEIHLKL